VLTSGLRYLVKWPYGMQLVEGRISMMDVSKARSANALTANTLTGRIVALDGEAFQFETDEGKRIVFTLGETSGVQPHHLEGIVRSPVRVAVTIDGPYEHATATRVGPCEQYHPGPPSPWGIGMRRAQS
jgi:hypothetical protein